MQPDDANFFLNPDGRPAAPVAATTPPQVATALRGLALLQVALIISLCASVLGGAVTTHMWTQTLGGEIVPLSFVLGIWRMISIGTAMAELVALYTLYGAPPAARVAELARPALVVRALGLGLSLLGTVIPMLASRFIDPHQLRQFFVFNGYAEAALGLLGSVFIIEILLRLRRFAAPNDRQLADNEGVLRAGLIGAVIARIVGHYMSRVLAPLFFGFGNNNLWLTFALQTMLSLLFFGLLLWLLQATIAALRSYQPTAAATANDPLTAPRAGAATSDTNDAGYRNMLFGGLWTLGGIAMTVLTYQSAHQLGGRYVVAYGAIIAGIIQFIRGLTQLVGSRQ